MKLPAQVVLKASNLNSIYLPKFMIGQRIHALFIITGQALATDYVQLMMVGDHNICFTVPYVAPVEWSDSAHNRCGTMKMAQFVGEDEIYFSGIISGAEYGLTLTSLHYLGTNS